jgi:hypothetical protein
MKIKAANESYVEKAKLLTEEEAERVLSRIRGKLLRRQEDKKLDRIDALAIQLELEDEQLQEWRDKMHSLREKELAKALEKSKKPAKAKTPAKTKVPGKVKVPAKVKTPAKAKTPAS